MNSLPFKSAAFPRGNPASVSLPHDSPVKRAASGPGTAPQPAFGSQYRGAMVGLSSQVIDLSVSRPNTSLARNANGGQRLQVSGNYVWLSYTTNLTDVIALQIGDRDPIWIQAGTVIQGMDFDYLIIYNDAVAAAKASIGYGFSPDPALKIVG